MFISEYIRRCQRVGELDSWTVRLVSSRASEPEKIGPYQIGLVKREPLNDPARERRYTIRRVVSPSDESRDLDPDQKDRALAATIKAAEGKLDKNGQPRIPTVPTGTPLRRVRRPGQALLLLYPLQYPPAAGAQDKMPPLVGFAISFPFSEHSTQTEYVVNEIWQQLALEGLDGDDEETG